MLRRLTLASLIANIAIVVTGGAVRLTASGLGCPTWPTCTAHTLTPTAEYHVHGLIEFSNRLLTFALTAVVVATLVGVRRARRRDLDRLAWTLVLGIPAQAVLGGITVLTGLSPWWVMAHFLLSCGLVAAATTLHQRSGPPLQPGFVPVPLRALAQGAVGLVAATLVVGTVVTGSGPHSGAPGAARTGLDPALVSQLHADIVLLLVGLTAGLLVALRTLGSPAARAAGILLLTECAQATVGFVQYFTGLPVVLVGAHLAGACLVLVAAVRLAQACAADRIASANRAAEPGAWRRNSDGSLTSSSSSSGLPSVPGTRSTLA